MQPVLLDVLKPLERAALVARLRPRHYRRGQAVFNDGDLGDCLHFVRTGRVELQVTTLTGQAITLRVVQPGEIFGELALVHPDRRRTGRVCALEPTETSALYRDDFEDLRQRHPGVDRLLIAALAERVVRTSQLAVDLLLPPEDRLWRRIAALADAYGDEPIRMSQDDLARTAGTVRQTANRVLQAGVRQGILTVQRNAVMVLDRAAVEQMARHETPRPARAGQRGSLPVVA